MESTIGARIAAAAGGKASTDAETDAAPVNYPVPRPFVQGPIADGLTARLEYQHWQESSPALWKATLSYPCEGPVSIVWLSTLLEFAMKAFVLSILMVGSIAATAVFAAPPAGAPSGTMGLCKDGSYSSSAEKKGACRGHKGVKDWYGDEAMAKTGAMPATGERAAPPPSAAITKTPAPDKPTLPAVAGRTSGKSMTPATGGGAGQVWANDSSKVYHCNGDKWYGKTKHGEYMSESDAKSKGFHAERGKACS